MALVFLSFAALLTAAESAFNYFPRHDAETGVMHSRGTALERILAQPVAHMRALRFWRVWFEMASAVAVTVLLHNLLDNVWLAGLVATGIMALVWLRDRRGLAAAAGPRPLRRPGPLQRPADPFALRGAGTDPGLAGHVWAARWRPGAPAGSEAFFSEEEFRELVDRATESDVIEDNEAELIQSVFDFGDTLVRSVMVPRTDILCIDSGSSLHRAMSLFLRSGYSRIPVIGENTDQVLGIVYLKDVAAVLHRLGPGQEPPVVDELAREVRYVPDSKPVSELLRELQKESTHVAIVIDEYGGTAGLVTLEDLIEEIVGEIVDEYDTESAEAVDAGDGSYRVSARMSIDDLGELFDLELDDDEVDTVGGLLAKALGRVPIVGSTVDVHGLTLRADRLEGRRNRVSHIIAAAVAKRRPNKTDLEDLLDEAAPIQQGVPREQAE